MRETIRRLLDAALTPFGGSGWCVLRPLTLPLVRSGPYCNVSLSYAVHVLGAVPRGRI